MTIRGLTPLPKLSDLFIRYDRGDSQNEFCDENLELFRGEDDNRSNVNSDAGDSDDENADDFDQLFRFLQNEES